MTTDLRTPTLTVAQARMLGADLVAALGKTPGDPDAVTATLHHWLDELGPYDFAVVCMGAIQTTFADCLTMRRIEDWPTEGGITLDIPERKTDEHR